jgi:hypothetical protein
MVPTTKEVPVSQALVFAAKLSSLRGLRVDRVREADPRGPQQSPRSGRAGRRVIQALPEVEELPQQCAHRGKGAGDASLRYLQQRA